MNKFGLTTFIDNLPEGYEFERDKWPAHITQVDTFETVLRPEEMSEKLNSIIKEVNSLSVKVLSEEYFGPEKDILVYRLERDPSLQELHTKIVSGLKELGVNFKRPFLLEEGFKPHVTVIPGLNLKVNDEVAIESITLIDKNSLNKRVVTKNYYLQT